MGRAQHRTAPPPLPKKKPADVVEFIDVEQGSVEWKLARLGTVTASVFSHVIAKGEEMKMRKRLLYQLAGELLSGEPAETYSNRHMERGKEMEPEAREFYAFTRNVELTRIGFVRRTIQRGIYEPLVIGASPDSLVGEDGALEVKTLAPHLMVELAERGTFPSEHRAQVQGIMWVTGRAWCDLLVFYRGMPIKPTFRVERDENFIRELSDAVEIFDYDLRQLVARIRRMA